MARQGAGLRTYSNHDKIQAIKEKTANPAIGLNREDAVQEKSRKIKRSNSQMQNAAIART